MRFRNSSIFSTLQIINLLQVSFKNLSCKFKALLKCSEVILVNFYLEKIG